MNQILVSEKVIVTKEMRKKKKFYKKNFFISIFLVCMLFSYYVYAEYDRNKNEEVSHEILNSITTTNEEDNTTMEEALFIASNYIKIENDILKVYLGNESDEEIRLGNILKDVQSVAEDQAENIEEDNEPVSETYVAEDGVEYTAEAIVKIPSLGIEYPVLSETSEELLKISVNKLWGPNPNEVGNYVIVGHNYKSGKMFGKLKNIKNGDIIELTDLTGKTIKYSVFTTYIIDPSDVSCTSQLTNGKKEITLITCSNSGTKRFVVQAYEQ
jgi:LPXTG-site transpeptidase (sortase) family protein